MSLICLVEWHDTHEWAYFWVSFHPFFVLTHPHFEASDDLLDLASISYICDIEQKLHSILSHCNDYYSDQDGHQSHIADGSLAFPLHLYNSLKR